jgi:hypothetical protein
MPLASRDSSAQKALADCRLLIRLGAEAAPRGAGDEVLCLDFPFSI